MSLDVHSYDGKLPRTALPLERVQALTAAERKERAAELQQLCPNQILELLIRDFDTAANFDTSNQLRVEELLALCWELRSQPDFLTQLNLQLDEMRSGLCPQGRTHRLYQLLLAFGVSQPQSA